MAEYIDRSAFWETWRDLLSRDYTSDYGKGFKAGINAVKSEPISNVAPVVHGEWVGGVFRESDGEYMEQCSACKMWPIAYGCDYFPNCGARMDGDGNALTVTIAEV